MSAPLLQKPTPTGREVSFGDNEIIVSKTDLKGHITYTNDIFQRVSGYTEAEILGQPHNVIRHPEMPRCVFALMWETISSGKEIFAYVLNLAKTGDGYWVLAHVTPSHDRAGRHIGYHSNRRVPYADALEKIRPLYRELRALEKQQAASPREALAASRELLRQKLAGQDYGRFIFSLSEQTTLDHSIR